MSKLVRELAKSHLDAERRSRLEKQQKVAAEEKRQKSLTGLVDFVPRINPRFVPPVHLAAVAELFERAEREPIRAVVSAPPRHGKPLRWDTLVTMADGSERPIGKIRVGDRVVSGRGRDTSVTAVFEQGEMETLWLRTRSGPGVHAEKTHRFLTQRGWVRAGDLDCEDTLRRLVDGKPVTEDLMAVFQGEVARCVCITVADDASFLANGLITHNTELLLTAVAWRCLRHPELTNCYATYNLPFALSKSRVARDYALAAGVQLREDAASLTEWRTHHGGGLLATSVGGVLTGHGVNMLLIDDPHKDRAHAESAVDRAFIHEWFRGTAMTRVEPGGSVIVFHCVARGEPVLMANGEWRAVEAVQAGDFVTGYQGGEYVARQVTATRLSGVDRVMRIATARKSAVVNARHPFLLESGEWRKAGELREGDRIVALDTGIGADRSVDPEFAWFFGFMVGDGWVTDWSRGKLYAPTGKTHITRSWCVCVAKKVDEDVNARVVRAFERFFGKTPKLTKFGYYRLDSNSAGRRMVELGLTGGARGKRIPDWAFRMAPDLKEAFLRGYVAADGCRAKRCRDSYRLASVSRELLDGARLLAISAGVTVGKIGEYKQRVKPPNSKEYIDSTIFSASFNFAARPDRVETIEAITDEGTSDVFDLTVDGAESFIVGGLVCHNTRWREDDLIGELLRDEENEWENVWLPAISDAGEPLWPERWTVEALTKRRSEVGEYDWASQYQGRPQPKSGQLFGDVTFYDELPKDGYRIGIGVDMAYSTKKKADWSVAVVCYRRGDIVYVADVIRMQELQPKFHARLKAESDNRYKGARWRMYVSSTEKGLTDMAQADGLPLVGVLATQDKYVRALPAAGAWNAGKLRVPRDAPWLEEFLRELQAFDKGRYDDQVDALAAAFDCLDTPSQKTPDVRVHQPETAGLYVDD